MKRTFLQLVVVMAALPGLLTAALFAPPTFVEGDIEHRFEMGYERDGVRFGFFSDGEEVTLALEIPTKHWKILSSKEKALFRLTDNGNYIFGYSNGQNDPWQEAEDIFTRRDAARFAAPLDYQQTTPIEIDRADLGDWVSGRRVLFYSGAGISRDSGIPDMRGLEEQLAIAPDILKTVVRWIETPEAIAEKVLAFYVACQKGDPSRSHQALSHLAYVTNQQILTENLDPMHERMGTRPLRVSKEALVESDYLEEVDAIICVGLSKDDKGFLRLMKQIHPDVKIIAVNPACPTYLGNDDLWCPHSAHDVLEIIATGTMTHKLAFVAFNR